MIRTFAGLRPILMLAGAALAAGCSSPSSRLDLPPRWLDAGTPSTTVAVERVTRYYVDETGALWDDRGRKYEAAP
jgi:hypothetical protein